MSHQQQRPGSKRLKTHHASTSTELQYLIECLSWDLADLRAHQSSYEQRIIDLTKHHSADGSQTLCVSFETVQQYQEFYTVLHYSNTLAELTQKYTANNTDTNQCLYSVTSCTAHHRNDYLHYVELISWLNVGKQSLGLPNISRGDLLILRLADATARDTPVHKLLYVDTVWTKPQESVYIKALCVLQYDVDADVSVLERFQRKSSELYSVTVCDVAMVNCLREFTAIQNVPNLDIVNQLVQPTSQLASDTSQYQQHVFESWTQNLTTKYRTRTAEQLNESQLHAVQVVVCHTVNPRRHTNSLQQAVTLCCGPPGTGKSKTAVAMLNSLHVIYYQRHFESIIDYMLHSMHSQAAAHLKHKLDTASAQFRPPDIVDLTSHHYAKPASILSNTANKTIVLSGSKSDLSSILNSMQRPQPLRSVSPAPSAQSETSACGATYLPIVQPKPRFLVCCPSNGAVDQLISRVLKNFVDGQAQSYKPDIVRIGNSDSMRSSVKQIISLDSLADAYLAYDADRLQSKIKAAGVEIQKIDTEMFNAHMQYYKLLQAHEAKFLHSSSTKPQDNVIRPRQIVGGAFIARVVDLHERRYRMFVDAQRWKIALTYVNAKASHSNTITHNAENTNKMQDTNHMIQLRDQLRVSILNTSHIVCSTLSGSGLDLLSTLDRQFDALLIDEAAQSVESSTLIAMKHNAQHTVLIGDVNQLPATVFTQLPLLKQYYERSLFERLQQAGQTVLTLNTQYRMHPQIASFPSKHFYSPIGGLLNGTNVSGAEYAQLYHAHTNYKPFVFWNVLCDNIQKSSSGSLHNATEATFIIKLLVELLTTVDSTVQGSSIAVLTFYTHHRNKLQQLIQAMIADLHRIPMSDVERAAIGKLQDVEVCTVDSYQGRECDIVVVSCVRGGNSGHSSRHSNSLGFISDVRRMNVSLTRARYACWVVGDSRALKHDADWKALMDSAKERHVYRQANELVPANSTPTSTSTEQDHTRGKSASPLPPQTSAQVNDHQPSRPLPAHKSHQHRQTKKPRPASNGAGNGWVTTDVQTIE